MGSSVVRTGLYVSVVEQANSDPHNNLDNVVLICGLEVPHLHRVSISFAGTKSQPYFKLKDEYRTIHFYYKFPTDYTKSVHDVKTNFIVIRI